MTDKIITAIAMVFAGAAMRILPDVAKPVLYSVAGACVIGIIAELHSRNKKRSKR